MGEAKRIQDEKEKNAVEKENRKTSKAYLENILEKVDNSVKTQAENEAKRIQDEKEKNAVEKENRKTADEKLAEEKQGQRNKYKSDFQNFTEGNYKRYKTMMNYDKDL